MNDLLLKAADYIEEHGWCQYQFEDSLGRVCADGALTRAVPGVQSHQVREHARWLLKCYILEHVDESEATHIVGVSRRAGKRIIAVWNDLAYLTQREVVETMRLAAREEMS